MSEQQTAPVGVDVTIPNGARIYDFMLGGKDNFAADRAAAKAMLAAAPQRPRRHGRTGRSSAALCGS